MDFTRQDLETLAEAFEAKAEQLLEAASSIRESASIMTPAKTEQKPFIMHVAEAPEVATEQHAKPETRATKAAEALESAAKAHLEANERIDRIWRYVGEYGVKGRVERRIIDCLFGAMAGKDTAEIIQYCKANDGFKANSVRAALSRLLAREAVTRLGRGHYVLRTAPNGAAQDAATLLATPGAGQ